MFTLSCLSQPTGKSCRVWQKKTVANAIVSVTPHLYNGVKQDSEVENSEVETAV